MREKKHRAPDPALAQFYRDMSRHPLLSASEELEACKAIERAETDCWIAILSFVPVAQPILKMLGHHITVGQMQPLAFEDLIQSYWGQGSRLFAKQSFQWETVCEQMGRRIRLEDKDREWRAEARRIGAQPPTPHRKETPQTSQAHSEYLARVKAAEGRQQRLKERFAQSNIRLVISIAKGYDRGLLPMGDLIQEGCIGLLKSVNRFDYKRGWRFSTFASWWIRHSLARGISDTGRLVRVPVHLLDRYNRFERGRQTWVSKHGREPTIDELEKVTGLTPLYLKNLATLSLKRHYSLDKTVGDSGDNDHTFLELLRDESAPSATDDMESSRRAAKAHEFLDTLTEKEADVLRQRYGFDGDNDRTLKEIGEDYGVSRERIRQIQNESLAKLRTRARLAGIEEE